MVMPYGLKRILKTQICSSPQDAAAWMRDTQVEPVERSGIFTSVAMSREPESYVLDMKQLIKTNWILSIAA